MPDQNAHTLAASIIEGVERTGAVRFLRRLLAGVLRRIAAIELCVADGIVGAPFLCLRIRAREEEENDCDESVAQQMSHDWPVGLYWVSRPLVVLNRRVLYHRVPA